MTMCSAAADALHEVCSRGHVPQQGHLDLQDEVVLAVNVAVEAEKVTNSCILMEFLPQLHFLLRMQPSLFHRKLLLTASDLFHHTLDFHHHEHQTQREQQK